MTTPNDDPDDRAFVRALFGGDHAPRDIVPGSGLTREDLLGQNAAVGTFREVEQPGEVLLDVDGVPIGMEPSTRQTVYVGGSVVTLEQLVRVGLTPDDVPNLIVRPNPQPRQERP